MTPVGHQTSSVGEMNRWEADFVAVIERCWTNIRAMGSLVFAIVAYIVRSSCRVRLALEAAALRQQLAAFSNGSKLDPGSVDADRLFARRSGNCIQVGLIPVYSKKLEQLQNPTSKERTDCLRVLTKLKRYRGSRTVRCHSVGYL